MNYQSIKIVGARTHNLKNIDVEIPIGKITAIYGPSGSGKTSLAFHTLYAESRRRLIHSFPTSMKLFLSKPTPVEVDEIVPVLPTFALPQINPVLGSRSTVSDLLRITESWQNLFFTFSEQFCPIHNQKLQPFSFEDYIKEIIIIKRISSLHLLIKRDDFLKLFPQTYPTRTYNEKKKVMVEFDENDEWWELQKISAKTVLDKIFIEKFINFPLFIWHEGLKKKEPLVVSHNLVCSQCKEKTYKKVIKYLTDFTPYSAKGACSACDGFGAKLIFNKERMILREKSVEDGGLPFLEYKTFSWDFSELKKVMKNKGWKLQTPLKKLPPEFFKVLDEGSGKYCGIKDLEKYLISKKYKPSVKFFIKNYQKEEVCDVCLGSRYQADIKEFSLSFSLGRFSLHQLSIMTIDEVKNIFQEMNKMVGYELKLRSDIFHFLSLASQMGLGHLKLNRKAKTLSAGEYQRLILLKYLSFQGTDSLFVLDEPTVGLGPKETSILWKTLKNLVQAGNTVLLVEHFKDFIQKSDFVIEMGPAAGHLGGEIVYQGTPKIENKIKITSVKKVVSPQKNRIQVTRPFCFDRTYNDFSLIKNHVNLVKGESGSGKTSSIINVLAQQIYLNIHGKNLVENIGSFKEIKGDIDFTDVTVFSSQINRWSSRSTVGSITGLADILRKNFIKLDVSNKLGLKEGHFSPNSELGMCPICEGQGLVTIEMHFLEDVTVECEECRGDKLKKPYSQIHNGKFTIVEGYRKPLKELFLNLHLSPKFLRIKQYLETLSLDYLSLDRSLQNLSGGERQRLLLVTKLATRPENQLYIFENLSFGISFLEMKSIAVLFDELSKNGNTIVVIDPNPEWDHFSWNSLEFKHLSP